MNARTKLKRADQSRKRRAKPITYEELRRKNEMKFKRDQEQIMKRISDQRKAFQGMGLSGKDLLEAMLLTPC
jgi:hypothetical protein